jgi:hypothetical protein
MNELTPQAKELVESHRRSRVLPRADRERMKRKLMLRVATLGAGTAATGTAMGMSLVSKIALVALGITAAAGTGGLSVWALRARTPAEVMAPSHASPPMAPQIVEPAPVATPEGSVNPADVAPMENGHSEHAKKTARRTLAPASPSPAATQVVAVDPEPELRVLRQAREDLRAGRPESAYRLLDEYGRQNSVGMLGQERKALSAIALCQWQPGPEAEARASEFLRTSPDSPLAKRVRTACEKTGKPSQ